MKQRVLLRGAPFILFLFTMSIAPTLPGQTKAKPLPPDTTGFVSGSNHWYNIADEEHVINPVRAQKRYKANQIANIADNILLYQKDDGGWPKNYDMMAILTEDQKKMLLESKSERNSTFDNGATHHQVRYLASAYASTREARHRDGCLRGLDYMLSAQYPNGGWPQFFPDTSGYRKYITFNDGAMIGVMEVLFDVVVGSPEYEFVDEARRSRVIAAFQKGLNAILRCQIVDHGVLTAWCQQHDNIDFRPQHARSYELPSISGSESADIVEFLMRLPDPSPHVIDAVQHAVSWFNKSKIGGIRVQEVKAPKAQYMFHSADFDREVVQDPKAPPIWARFYELGTGRPLFCNRDGKAVYSLKEVDRERRTGYGWYSYAPASVLEKYPKWQKRWAPTHNVLEH